MRSASVPTAASGMRLPVRSLAWQPAQFASNTGLPAAASFASIGNGYLGGGFAVRYSCSHFTSPRNSSFDFGAAPSRPSAESMITEWASWLSPAQFIVVPSAAYFFRFQIDGMSLGPKLL